MTTKVRITHLDAIDPVKVVVKSAAGAVQSQHALPGKGDEFELHVYPGQHIEVHEGNVEPVSVTGGGVVVHPNGPGGSPTDGKPK